MLFNVTRCPLQSVSSKRARAPTRRRRACLHPPPVSVAGDSDSSRVAAAHVGCHVAHEASSEMPDDYYDNSRYGAGHVLVYQP